MCKIITKGLVGLAPRRKRAGYTQKDFAEAMGVTQSVVARYETGEAWPSAANLPMMAVFTRLQHRRSLREAGGD